MYIWNKNGARIKKINKINSINSKYIEATYFENNNYILLSGYKYDKNKGKSIDFSECYNYDEDDIKTYKENENNSYIYCINLLKKGNEIYLITGYNEKINIFEFDTINLLNRIQLMKNILLC